MPVIGVTGTIGSGKSTVAKLFASWGAIVVSGDKIGHQLLMKSPRIRRELVRVFGDEILRSGVIDRKLLAKRAFSGPRNILKLNEIVHPALIRRMNREIRAAKHEPGARAAVIDAALLVEWGIGRVSWDYLVGVAAPFEARSNRLRRRGLTHAQIRQFSRAQMPWPEKRIHCDFVINNNSSLMILRRQARLCWEKVLLFHREKSTSGCD